MKNRSGSGRDRGRRRVLQALAFALSVSCAVAKADLQDIVIPCTNVVTSYGVKDKKTITPTGIKTNGFGGNVTWTPKKPGSECSRNSDATVFTCVGLTITVPQFDKSVDPTKVEGQVQVSGTGAGPISAEGAKGAPNLELTVQDAVDPSKKCTGKYRFHVSEDGGGWGDPHLTTVDGVHYDFQSAGEFTALKEEGLEIQTRQSPVPTATVPITNEYTGIRHCVAIYTAVAARLGHSTVSLQPNADAEANPLGMVLRINGRPVTLGEGEAPIVFSADGGEIGASAGLTAAVDGSIRRLDNGVFEITDARGTQIVVTPNYWPGPNVWYLNLNVYQTSAFKGTMGQIAEGSWLPALRDGTSLGPRPDTDIKRYDQLYKEFADSWRVGSTSLFDYDVGTDTSTYTVEEWPRNNPQSCALQGGPAPVQPATQEVAETACANVSDATRKEDCTFDVMVTGHSGFAQSYEVMQQVLPRGSGWYSPPTATSTPDQPPAKKPWWWWWWILLLILLIIIIIRFISKKSGTP